VAELAARQLPVKPASLSLQGLVALYLHFQLCVTAPPRLHAPAAAHGPCAQPLAVPAEYLDTHAHRVSLSLSLCLSECVWQPAVAAATRTSECSAVRVPFPPPVHAHGAHPSVAAVLPAAGNWEAQALTPPQILYVRAWDRSSSRTD
jgi:hypothetical protein